MRVWGVQFQDGCDVCRRTTGGESFRLLPALATSGNFLIVSTTPSFDPQHTSLVQDLPPPLEDTVEGTRVFRDGNTVSYTGSFWCHSGKSLGQVPSFRVTGPIFPLHLPPKDNLRNELMILHVLNGVTGFLDYIFISFK